MQKRYWLRGGIVGLIASIFVVLVTSSICSDFYRIGPAYPTDQPVCYSLIVNGIWQEIAILVFLLGLVIGWIYGKDKNRNIPNS
ncbi:MAG: hypothetical protein NUV47_00705 [Patescibacteria group bacterium]|nr:hypothetical protein [Patescibacteria group bacterium]